MNQKKWNKYVNMFNHKTAANLCADTTVPDIIRRLLPEKGNKLKVLEVGCGRFGLYDLLKSKGYECTGIDLNISKNIGERKILKMDMHLISDLKKEIGIFDYITCSNVFEHSIAPLILMNEMKEMLKKNGKLLIIIPDYIDTWIFEPSHLTLLTNKQMKNISEKIGLELKTYLELGEGGIKMRAFLYKRGEDAL